MIAPGLSKGASVFNSREGRETCWDNIHWWGARPGGSIISAPGAFHALHMHWRWGSLAWLPDALPRLGRVLRPAPKEHEPQFQGVKRGERRVWGGALVDAAIWIQTIRSRSSSTIRESIPIARASNSRSSRSLSGTGSSNGIAVHPYGSTPAPISCSGTQPRSIASCLSASSTPA
jgi:hypothetical protein